jgi:hypothetical protein
MRPGHRRNRHAWSIVRRLWRCGGSAILTLALGRAASAEEALDEGKRWVPSFGLFFDAIQQKAKGSLSTGPVLGAPLSPNDQAQDAFADGNGCLRRVGQPPTFAYSRDGGLCASARPNRETIMASSRGGDTSVSPVVGGSLELMTPSLLGDVLLRPRLFAHGDGAAAFSYERNLAGQESPGNFGLARQTSFAAGTDPDLLDVEEITVQGQGSRTRMQLEPFVLSAGGGIALSLDVFGRTVRIKPSFEYLREEIEFSGVVHRAVKLRVPAGTANLDQFRLISLTSVEKRAYDGIGPGLELEVDAARLGPFVSSVYIMGRGYYLLGNLDVALSAINEVQETASWSAELDRWTWRGGVGFRLRWLPESD